MKKIVSILIMTAILIMNFVPFAMAAETTTKASTTTATTKASNTKETTTVEETTAETTEETVVEIYKYEDLLKIAENPSGSYKLMKDIDCANEVWTPIDFSGKLDGNGFAIMNLSIEEAGETERISIDGNRKEWTTVFAGLFGVMENAVVTNLSLLGFNVDVASMSNCYAGSLAGYMADSTIKDCRFEGTVKLSTNLKEFGAFGVGGVVGYGWGSIDNCAADVTLISIDLNKDLKDEQFTGGIFANGYVDVTNCTVNIAGYTSEHGYVHDGGLSGMYVFAKSVSHKGTISNNTITGFITFFEDNKDRRAYCVGLVGEIMNGVTREGNDITGFERKEIKTYDTDLLPETCDKAEYDTEVVEPTEGEYGYTIYKCKTCDYSYKADYTSLNVYVEPTTETIEETASTASSISLTTIMPYLVAAIIIIVGVIVAIIKLNVKKK